MNQPQDREWAGVGNDTDIHWLEGKPECAWFMDEGRRWVSEQFMYRISLITFAMGMAVPFFLFAIASLMMLLF